jgi:hypothetical protein
MGCHRVTIALPSPHPRTRTSVPMARVYLHMRARFHSARRDLRPACARALRKDAAHVGHLVFFTYTLLVACRHLRVECELGHRTCAGVIERARAGEITRLSVAAHRDERHAESHVRRRRTHVSTRRQLHKAENV